MSTEALTSFKTRELVFDAVQPRSGFSLRSLQERLFAHLFQGLVYAQIWEDPVVDMEAMALQPGHHVVCIASGGCNALSYLTASPAKVTAVDLNRAHVALLRLKLQGLVRFEDWQSFFNFFGVAESTKNVDAYEAKLAPNLDHESRFYWEGNSAPYNRRINGFTGNFYKKGLLGKFISAGHLLARLYGLRFDGLLACTTMEQQKVFFTKNVEPLFSRPLVKFLLKSPMALFGLGIPPAQHDALSGGDAMVKVLHERLRRLACDFPIRENYFAWQAFNRAYEPSGQGALPPYLQKRNFELLRRNATRLDVQQANITTWLSETALASVDRVVLLDAQDWMDDTQLNALWRAITRATAPGARVIFRTAGKDTILPGRVDNAVLGGWNYLTTLSRALHDKDRSSIYGGFHVYERKA